MLSFSEQCAADEAKRDALLALPLNQRIAALLDMDAIEWVDSPFRDVEAEAMGEAPRGAWRIKGFHQTSATYAEMRRKGGADQLLRSITSETGQGGITAAMDARNLRVAA